MKMTNKRYDQLKWITQYFLPAFGTLYFTLAEVWNLPYSQEVVGTVVAVTAFLGVLLGISSAQYDKGQGTGSLIIDRTDDEKDKVTLRLDQEVDDILESTDVTLKVEVVR